MFNGRKIMKNSRTGVRYIKSDDINYPKNATIEGNVVWITHTTTTKRGKVYIKTGIDLTNLDSDRVKIGCGYQELIQVIRPRFFRNLTTDEAIATDGKVLDPVDYPAEGRTKKSPLEKARDTLVSLSKAEFVGLMKREYGMGLDEAIALYNKKHSQ